MTYGILRAYPMSADPTTLPPEAYEECGACGHYPAYCTTKGCTAWVAEATPSGYCACAGRVKPVPRPKAAPPQEDRWPQI